MTNLEKSMESLIVTFHRYAKDDGDKKTLTKKDLKKLLENELPNFLKSQNDQKVVDNIMKDLDNNKDDKLDFEEFIPLIAGLSMACEKCYNLSLKKGKK
ncbi:protein S100-A10b [Acanthochromis polyacanthus]|uniref:Protein S100 n=1 Tax=Acanthochromis polyacanthus TaxID=80966 RepID=A0A3Q1ESD2_9TELE|nr:protein S100-A10b [Acanthochromis polyacanthus]XP_022065002.1 protein S100-A10b [Acanthochromis polyacanthus]